MTFPLDITKTRLQTQGEIAAHLAEASGKKPPPYRGMIRTAIGIGMYSLVTSKKLMGMIYIYIYIYSIAPNFKVL